MFGRLSLAIACVLVCGVCFASAPTNVTVTLTGPDEGWAGSPLSYSADVQYDLDQDTEEEVDEDQASVHTEWSWSYSPASCETPPAEHSSETFKFSEDDAPGEYTITATCEVVVEYADGTSHSSSGSDSIDVKIKLYVNVSLSASKAAICAGAQSSAPHQCTITATATDRNGDPMSGRSISFSIDDPEHETYVNSAASFSPGSATTDQDGHATTTLTSSDKQCTLVVKAQDSESEDDATTSVGVSIPSCTSDPSSAEEEAGTPVALQATLAFGGDAVPGHSVNWEATSVTLADGTAGQTGANSSDQTDANGVANTSFSHTPAAWVTLTVSDTSCYDSDENRPTIGSVSLTFFELDHLVVYSAYKCDDNGNWAAGIQNEPANVVIRAILRPAVYDVDIDDPWTGGTAGPDDLTRYVSKQTAASTSVSCEIGGVSDSVTIYICQVTGLSVYAGGSEANGCAVTTVEPSGNSYIVLQAAISPTPPTIPGALLWWSGASRDQTVPTRAGVSRQYATSRAVTCAVGDSSVTMWVYVLDFDVRVPGVGDDVEDDTPAELYVNSDDDNGNSQDDRSDSPVSGEDDLYEVVVTIEPEGAPAGTLDLEWYSTGEQPYSDDIALWEDRNKTDEADTSYTVGSGAPDSVWVEGLVVSTNEGDEHLKITYSWGSAELSDTVHFTVLPRGGISGSSGATLKLYSNESLTTEASSPAAGILYPVLEVTVGEGERLSSTTAPLILRDDWRHYFTGTEVALGLDDALSPDGGWKKWDPVEEEWATDSGPVGSDNKDGSEPLRYRAILAEWNTMQQPLGNNGDHSVFLGKEVDDEWEVAHLEFEEWEVGTGWTNAYEIEPEPISIATSNLCITDCTASNGTIDYFKWDPDGDASLAQPHITFTIVDPDPHKYTVVVRYRETMGEGTWNWDTGGWSWYKADVQDDLTVDLNLTSPGYDQECLNADDNPWGTYTYDLLVMEYDGPTPAWVQANAIDWQFLKRYRDGYHLWVPENLPSPHGDEPGHEVWTDVPENGDAGLRGFYCLESDWGAQEAQVSRGNDAQIVIVDPELEERSNTSGPAAVETLGADYGTEDADSDGELDGLPLYTYQDSDPAGTWRGIFMANDNGGVHSPKWRTHEPVRMLTANQYATRKQFDVWHNTHSNWAFDDTYLNKDWVKRWLLRAHGIPYRWIDNNASIDVQVVGGNVFSYLTDQQKACTYEHCTVFSFVDRDVLQLPMMKRDSYGGTQEHHGTPSSPDVAFVQKNVWDAWCQGKSRPELFAFFTHIYFHELGHALHLSDEGSDQDPPEGDDSLCIMRWAPEFPRWSQSWGDDDPWQPHVEQHRSTAIKHLGGRP